jgi:hypothetical protein
MDQMISVEELKIPPGVRQTESEDGAVLLDIEQGICFSLNAVGLKIWEMLKRRSPIEQIADSLEEQFHIPRAELMADICEFIVELESQHLILHGSPALSKRGWLSRLQFWKTNDFRGRA